MSIEDDIIVKPEEWRVGRKVPINVYDERDQPVCQCQSPAYAQLIVKSVNADHHYAAREREAGTGLICAEWRRLSDGCVARCDRPRGHEGGHLDSVIDIAWPVRTAQGEPHD